MIILDGLQNVLLVLKISIQIYYIFLLWLNFLLHFFIKLFSFFVTFYECLLFFYRCLKNDVFVIFYIFILWVIWIFTWFIFLSFIWLHIDIQLIFLKIQAPFRIFYLGIQMWRPFNNQNGRQIFNENIIKMLNVVVEFIWKPLVVRSISKWLLFLFFRDTIWTDWRLLFMDILLLMRRRHIIIRTLIRNIFISTFLGLILNLNILLL